MDRIRVDGRRALRAHSVTALLVTSDAGALLLSILAAFALRFEGEPFADVLRTRVEPRLASLPLAAGIYVAVFLKLCLYRREWRFAGVEVLWRVLVASTSGIVCLVALQTAMFGGTFPRSVLVIAWMLATATTGGSRVALRVLCAARHRSAGRAPGPSSESTGSRRVVILGGGALGARAIRAMGEDPSLAGYRVVGFLDDDIAKHGLYIGSARVLGPISYLGKLLSRRAMDEVIVALPEDCTGRLRDQVLECRRQQIPVKRLLYERDVLLNNGSVSLADFSVEDLLRRPQADTDTTEIAAYLRGKRVLITGAGGSIGSELCRQISRQCPASLVLLGHGEHSIHTIFQELRADYPEMASRAHCAIADVSNRRRLAGVFSRHSPQVVFHTAAHKHVPLMEANPREAVHNNVTGTSNVAEACGRFGAERMVLISSDKAVDPCSIMGATKWLSEQVVRAEAETWRSTSFVTVRFGNVLGSRGSVVPIFREQIRRGGPVTVTHPEMTRYFMTIPEAVRLVLQAGAVGQTGQLYLLDMGEPVRILDLARDMICLSGLKPGDDIPIEITGLRAGERVHECLASSDESVERTPWPGLLLVRGWRRYDAPEIHSALLTIARITEGGEVDELLECLRELVPSYCATPREERSLIGATAPVTRD